MCRKDILTQAVVVVVVDIITTSSWRAGQELILRELGPAKTRRTSQTSECCREMELQNSSIQSAFNWSTSNKLLMHQVLFRRQWLEFIGSFFFQKEMKAKKKKSKKNKQIEFVHKEISSNLVTRHFIALLVGCLFVA